MASLTLTTGILTNRNIVVTRAVVPERAYADSCVLRPSGVGKQRAFTHRRVSVTCGVARERTITKRIVEWSRRIASERFKAKRIIIVSSCVAEQGERSIGCIGTFRCCWLKALRLQWPYCRLRCYKKGSGPSGSVEVTGNVTLE